MRLALYVMFATLTFYSQFIQMNRAETLVMCASDNPVLTQKLGFPIQLVGLGDTAVVAHVNIEHLSQYAEAAAHADNTRW